MSTEKQQQQEQPFSASNKTFILGCITGAITISALTLFRKYLSASATIEKKQESIEIKQEIKQEIKEEIVIKQETNKVSNNNNKIHDNVYKRLQSEIRPKNKFYFQSASNDEISFVIIINILIEYLPNSIIKILFEYLLYKNDKFNINIANYLQQGWNINNNKLHDNPDIYIENVLPIYNQPSIILTIGLPGSGKTTWAKIRLTNKYSSNCIAADDYFDKFNNGQFNVSLLSKAHHWAQQEIFKRLCSGKNVIVNNTNTTLSEMYIYIIRTIFSEYPYKIVFAIMPERNINTLSRRGLHGVPPKKCKQMLQRMDYWLKKGPPSIYSVMKSGPFRRNSFGKANNEKIIYYGVFFGNQFHGEIQNKIRQYFISMTNKPLLSDLTDCHLTLKFQPNDNDIDKLPFNKRVKLKIIGYVCNKFIQTFIVDILDNSIKKLCNNKYPHITISLNKSLGIRPNYSNQLLDYGQIIPVIHNYSNNILENGGLIVEGIIGAYYQNPNGGVSFNRRNYQFDNQPIAYNDNQQQQSQQKSQQQPQQQKKRKRRRGGRGRNKNNQ